MLQKPRASSPSESPLFLWPLVKRYFAMFLHDSPDYILDESAYSASKSVFLIEAMSSLGMNSIKHMFFMYK